MKMISNKIVSSEIGSDLFHSKLGSPGVFGSGDIVQQANLFFRKDGAATGDVYVEVRCLQKGRYSGGIGNGVSVVLNKMGTGRYAMQVFFKLAQVNGNVISSSGGLAAVVDKFNLDKDLNNDFIAILKIDSTTLDFTDSGIENALSMSGGLG